MSSHKCYTYKIKKKNNFKNKKRRNLTLQKSLGLFIKNILIDNYIVCPMKKFNGRVCAKVA